jgi:hypothetical protein
MPMRVWFTSAAISAFFLAVPATAQDASAAAEDAIAICSAWLMKPDNFAKAWTERGYRPGQGGIIGKSWENLSIEKDGGSIIASKVTYPDATSRTCQLSTQGSLSLKGAEALLAKVAADPEFGAFTGELGEQSLGGDRKMILGVFKRPGANPFVGASINSFNEFTNIIFYRTDFDKAN